MAASRRLQKLTASAVIATGYLRVPQLVWAQLCASMQVTDRSLVWNTDLMETLELENLLINAAITMHSAEQRKVRAGGCCPRRGRTAAGC